MGVDFVLPHNSISKARFMQKESNKEQETGDVFSNIQKLMQGMSGINREGVTQPELLSGLKPQGLGQKLNFMA